MKMTAELIKKIQELEKKYSWDYEKVCIRVQDVPFELGEMDHQSSIWIDDEETDENLDGICTLSVKYAKNAEFYYGDHLAIVAGNEFSYGQDEGEIIIHDPVVLEVLS